MRITPQQDARFAAAMARAGAPAPARNGSGAPASAIRGSSASAIQLASDDILLGTTEFGAPLGVNLQKLAAGRLLIQGVSDAGKSWTLRRLIEETATRIQQIVIDPENEFDTLADELHYPYIEARALDGAALGELARRVREQRLSVVLDFSEWGAEGKMEALSSFILPLIECAREHWHSAMVAIDEAHLFAPYGGADLAESSIRKASINAVVDLVSRGRKRGLCGVLATQRLARLSKSVASEVKNFLIGTNTLDLDIKRAAETIGWSARKAFDRLPLLEPGNFIAVGTAFSLSPSAAKIGPVRSRHKGSTPIVAPPALADAAAARSLIGVDELVRAAADRRSAADEEAAAPRVASTAPNEAAVEAGLRTVAWSEAENEILRRGYRDGLSMAEIVQALKAAGFRERSPGAIGMRARALGIRHVRSFHKWEPREDEIILDGYRLGKRMADILADLSAAGFERNFQAAQMRAIHLGCTNKDRQRPFAEREKKLVRDGLAAGKTRSEVLAMLRAEGFERSINSISKVAQRYGYHEKRRRWTEADLEEMRRSYAELGPRKLAEKLGYPVLAVTTKASLLGLRFRIPWSDEEIRVLTDAAEKGERLVDAAQRIGRPYANVAAMAKRMGLVFKTVLGREA